MMVHHLNCASMCPACSWLYAPRAAGQSWMQHARARHELVCHCLLIESRQGLVLVDSGLGTRDLAHRSSLGWSFKLGMGPRLDPEQTALAQVRALGHQARDVRHIVLTHLDLDHAGGIADFPHATVHVLHAEHQAAYRPHWHERLRYMPAQWAHQPKWQPHPSQGESWLGFDSVQAIPGLDDEVLLIPLPGHTRGHTAVAVRQHASGHAKVQAPWLLHCGDAYFSHQEMNAPHSCPPGLRLLQTLMEVDRRQRLHNQARLRTLARTHGDQVHLFCAHDPWELSDLRDRKGLQSM